MPKKKHTEQHDQDIHMEELGQTTGVEERQYTKNPSAVRQQSLGTPELRRRKSQMEQWEADLVEQLPSRQGGTIRLNKTLRARKKSQKLGYGTIRLPNVLNSIDTDKIVEKLLNDPDFADGPAELQTEDIKGLHTNLARKLSIQAKLRETEEKSKQSKNITWSKQLRYSIALLWKKTRVHMAEVSYSTDLWRGHLKKIEGKFGSGVASYFSFMIWLVELNIPVFILLFSFITIPQLLHRTTQTPMNNDSVPFKGIEILTGEGWLKDSELYYGTHYNGSIERVSGFTYSMPHAYLLTIAGYYIITVSALLYSLTKSYKKNFIDSSSMIQFESVTKVLSGWDFAITAPRAAALKQQSIHQELQEYLSVFRTSEVKRTTCQSCGVGFVRVFVSLLCLTLTAGAGYLIRYVSESLVIERDEFYGLEQLALPLVISAVIFILPLIFSFLADFENYDNPQVTLYLDMARTILLFIVSLGVIVQFWLSKADCSTDDNSANITSGMSSYRMTRSIANTSITSALTKEDQKTCTQCWENILGYNMYRLVIVDFLVTLLITFFTEFVRRLIARYCIKRLGYPEFNIGRNTLYLIYSQSLIWIAAFYSPLLPLIMVLKLVLLFYVKRYSVMNNCRPSIKPWRGGRAHTIIMTMLGLALILCFIVVGFSIVRLTPSETCGPYQGKDRSYAVIRDLLELWSRSEKTFLTIFQFVTSSGFLAAVILGLLIAAYYTRIRAHGLDDTVLALKEQIALEGKDKKFLIKLIQSAGPKPPVPRERTYNQNYTNIAKSPGEIDCFDDDDEGGKQFSKAIMDSSYRSPGEKLNTTAPGAPGAPTPGSRTVAAPTAQNSNGSDSPPGGPPQYANGHEDLAKRRSLLPPGDNMSLSTARPESELEPGVNPAYNDRSLTNRPVLPYPGQPYDIIKGDSNK